MTNEELLMLGKMDGKLDGLGTNIYKIDQRLDKLDARLRTVEQKAAVTGAISGTAVSVGMALVIEGMKQWLHRSGN